MEAGACTYVPDNNSIALIDILSEKNRLSSEYFKENIVREFDLTVYPARRKLMETARNSHVSIFEDALVHNMRTITQAMTECDFHILDHSAYSQNLASCDFFFLVTCTRMLGSMYETVEELEKKIRVVIQAISKSRSPN
jgi:hypothetical protein